MQYQTTIFCFLEKSQKVTQRDKKKKKKNLFPNILCIHFTLSLNWLGNNLCTISILCYLFDHFLLFLSSFMVLEVSYRNLRYTNIPIHFDVKAKILKVISQNLCLLGLKWK